MKKLAIADYAGFLLRLGSQECECGPIPILARPGGKRVIWKKTCLDVSSTIMRMQCGMAEPCWPCQARQFIAGGPRAVSHQV